MCLCRGGGGSAVSVTASRGLPHVWGSGSSCLARLGIVRWHEFLPKAGTEGAVVDSAADLQQEIGTAARPAHLLRLVHPAVHQEIGGPFGDPAYQPIDPLLSGPAKPMQNRL